MSPNTIGMECIARFIFKIKYGWKKSCSRLVQTEPHIGYFECVALYRQRHPVNKEMFARWSTLDIQYQYSTCLCHCSLGAHHDGVGDSCSASDMFLMTAAIGRINEETRANAFTFSPCALLAFKELLSGTTDG